VKKSLPRGMKAQTEKLAKLITLHCVRNTFLERLHAGTFPSSQTGDYSDVKVVSPYGDIAWNRLGRIDDDEMKKLVKEIVNKIFTFLLYFQQEPLPSSLVFPSGWDAAQIDNEFKTFWDLTRQMERPETRRRQSRRSSKTHRCRRKAHQRRREL
jgi:hypothetical protein